MSNLNFKKKIEGCVGHHDTAGFYFRRWFPGDVTAVFLRVNKENKINLFTRLDDEQKKKWQDNENNFIKQIYATQMGEYSSGPSSGNGNISNPNPGGGISPSSMKTGRATSAVEMERAFFNNIINTPINCPFFVDRDRVVIFHPAIDSILCFDLGGTFLYSVKINFHHSLKWGGRFFYDKTTERFYTMLENKNLPYFYAINTETGKLWGETLVTRPFIKREKVNNGYLYYLATEDRDKNNKMLYRIRLSR
jgi:hypothetical protein